MAQNGPIIVTAVGFGLLFLGLLSSWYIFPKVVKSQIHNNIDLVEGSVGYDTWKKTPFPLKFKVYLFNVSNAEAVQLGAKPIVKEVGPFIYDEYRERVNIEVEEDKDMLKYVLRKNFVFNAQESGCHSEEDFVTIINPALVGTALQVYLLVPTALSMVNDAVPFMFPTAKNIFLTAKVKDILFGGLTLYCQDKAVEFVCGAMKGALPKTVRQAPNGKDFIFSMFGHINNTDIGPWEMGRGLKNTTRGEVYSYEDEEVMSVWNDDYCNKINGSDTTVFYLPKDPPDQKLYSFAEDFCRSIYIEFENKTEEFGIPVLRYSNTVAPFDRTKENECFCPYLSDDDGEDYLACPPSGLADVTACIKGPVLISFPHFYLADKKLLEYVSGLNPQKDLHENYAHLEPNTATPVSGRKRIQMNIDVKPLEGFTMLENVSSGIFPILWVEEGVTLPPDFIELLQNNFSKIALLGSTKWITITFGIGTIIVGIVLILRKEKMLCFASNDKVDITSLKGTGSSSGGGETNDAYESNPHLYPQNAGLNLPMRQQTNLNNRQLNVQAWNGN